MIQFLFKDIFITTKDEGFKMNNKFIPRQPQNSQDFLAIENMRYNESNLILFPKKIMSGLLERKIEMSIP